MNLSIEQNNLYLNNVTTNQPSEISNDLDKTQLVEKTEETKLNFSAVSVNISNDNIQNFLNKKTAQFSQANANAQHVVSQIANGNSDYSGFFEGKKFGDDLTLESIGYEGKELSKLDKKEAKDLLKKDSFFAEDETAKRIAKYVEKITGNDVDALEETKRGLKRGYEEAQKIFNKEKPVITTNTESKTFDLIDKKIEEMLKTDLEKHVDTKFLENNKL